MKRDRQGVRFQRRYDDAGRDHDMARRDQRRFDHAVRVLDYLILGTIVAAVAILSLGIIGNLVLTVRNLLTL